MNGVTKRPNGMWRARYRDHEGREHARHFPRQRDAEAWLATVRADLVRGTYLDPKLREVTVRAYADEWLPAQPLRPQSAALYDAHLRNHILPVFGAKKLSQVTPTMVKGFVRSLGQPRTDGDRTRRPLAPTTVETVHGILSMLFKGAVRDGYLPKTPCVGTAPRDTQKRDVHPLIATQVAALSHAMPERLRLLPFVAAYLGLRQGEVLGLTVDRIDIDALRIRVDRQMQTLPDGTVTHVPPKTRSSVREVPLSASLAEELRALIEGHGLTGADLLFPNPKGDPWSRPRFGTVWRAAVKSAGRCEWHRRQDPETKEPCGCPGTVPLGTRMHDLRHTYASVLIADGAQPKVIQARLGHASIVETMDTYGHLFPESEDSTRDTMDRAFSGALADSVRTRAGLHAV